MYVGLLNNYLSENEPASWRRDYASPLDVVTSTIGNVRMVVDKYTLKPYKSTHFIGYTRPLALLLTFPFAGTIEVEALDWHVDSFRISEESNYEPRLEADPSVKV